MGMGELDRILKRDDVDRLVLVDLVQERSKRRRLAGPRCAGHEDDPVFFLGHLVEHIGEAEVLDGWNPILQLSENDGVIAPLGEDVHPEAGLPGQIIRGIARPLGQEGLCQPPVLIDQVEREDLRLKRGKRRERRLQFHADELPRSLHLK